MGTPAQSRTTKILLVVIAALISIIVGIITGLLSWVAEPSVPGAIMAGGGGFAASMTLCLLVMSALGFA
jgi:hypothetical protein